MSSRLVVVVVRPGPGSCAALPGARAPAAAPAGAQLAEGGEDPAATADRAVKLQAVHT